MPYLTPDSIPSEMVCRRLRIPNDIRIVAAVNGALSELCKSYRWEQFGAVTPDEIAAAMQTMYDEFTQPTECYTGESEPPFWEDAQNVADNDDDGIPWYDNLADWFLTGFLAVTASPQAGILYKTFVPKARVAFQRGDWGALFKVLLNGLEVTTGDSYAPIIDLLEIDLDLEQFAADHSLGAAPWDLRIEHNGTGASPASAPELRIVRKRLSEEEVVAITDIQQVGGQLQVRRGNSAVWENVPNANNVRIDGSTTITGQQAFRTGSADGLIKLNPNAGERVIDVRLSVTTLTDVLRVLNSSAMQVFRVDSNGRFQLRGNDNNQWMVMNTGADIKFNINTMPGQQLLTMMGDAPQNSPLMTINSRAGITLFQVGNTGQLINRLTHTMRGTSSIQERDMALFESTWANSTDATRRSKISISANDSGNWFKGMSFEAFLGANGGGLLSFFDGAGSSKVVVNYSPIQEDSVLDNLVSGFATMGLVDDNAYRFTKPIVSGDTDGNESLENLLEALETAGLITNATTSRQIFNLELTPDTGHSSVGTQSPKQTIVGETYTVTVKGYITFDGGSIGYSDACWEGNNPALLTGGSGNFGVFRIDNVARNGTRPSEPTHEYVFSITGDGTYLDVSFTDYAALPTGHFEIAIDGIFAN